MNESTKNALKKFTVLDTWYSGHPLDWKRFMDFIVEANKNQDFGISSEDFYSAFPNLNDYLEEHAAKMYVKYQDGIELLRHYDAS